MSPRATLGVWLGPIHAAADANTSSGRESRGAAWTRNVARSRVRAAPARKPREPQSRALAGCRLVGWAGIVIVSVPVSPKAGSGRWPPSIEWRSPAEYTPRNRTSHTGVESGLAERQLAHPAGSGLA